MKNKLYHRYSKKGIIFALDAILAVLLVISSLVFTNYFIFVASKDVSSNLQISRIGSDIITLLDNTKTLDTLDDESVEDAIKTTIPGKYGFRVNISWQSANATEESLNSFETGEAIPDNRFVATGKRFFLATNDEETNVENFAVARYWIWLK